jgi:hypothetical protein
LQPVIDMHVSEPPSPKRGTAWNYYLGATMPTLLLTPRYTPDSRALMHAAVAAGWDCVRLHDWRIPAEILGDDIVFYGEALLAAVIAESLPLDLLEPPPDWLAGLPHAFIQRQVRHMTLGEARQFPGPAFVKPAQDKCFPADIYTSAADLPSPGTVPESTPVLVAEPVTWELEIRCFVLDRQVVSLSPYLRDGRLAEAEDGSWPATDDEIAAALDVAATVLGGPGVQLPPAVALDIGTIAGRGWAVVEANAAWGSGLYGCDPARVLPVIQRACVRREVPADYRTT